MAVVKRRLYTDSDTRALHKELDEVSCPICMDHPHNAVLLLCSSYDKGCRSYICDTSYRHSNCLDRFKKLRNKPRCNTTLSSFLPIHSFNSGNTSERSLPLRTHVLDANENQNLNESNDVNSVGIPEGLLENSIPNSNRQLETQEGILEAGDSESFRDRIELEEADMENLKCPLCRGAVLGWEVVDEARKYLNLKKRSCSRESCSFVGNYQELRRHARRIHPTTRPSDVDSSRERAWRCLERQREYGDIVSAIRSAMPGAVVVGDYVIENGDRFSVEREGGTGEVNAPWWTTFFLYQMIGSIDGVGEPRARPRAWTRHRRASGALPEHRFLWGENLLGLQDDDDMHVLSDAGEDASPIPRRRRRLTRSRSDDQS
ncbi:hypothetical protein P3X46_011397 [Hevea brasiliensis]|uniref:Uncharacterized protein n=1 Tax=Hevea brasiliensis TaxID=3981 RepID=A0ABQ9M723_HEVBR|nr:uncharacterized protein LOC110639379 [Hevea brasiliensis]XP_058005492.1 uncharacterized protein LOC110639379 [Hevea brasiliensis]XP_058005493.1 uncharacterized protein LOC110639379 [Hevea brasiliensis]XP_058005494.1 uncharacterized protein LOC110639379 [Hevea brasiliensis]XP_058005495.1 uncharacterized protein LOC110639379 [Hevea brasiliensis]XP_058005496.1 uncharacterized protein LOC110639379 [Hevea brasiliensis]KAJ9176047.1 hypothetical protein P3X46_011397 [Hevea brasiliensis]